MTIHIYRCENPKRTRCLCPHHNKLEYGERQEFYDTARVFFDCGTLADYGYGYYYPPKKYKRLKIFWDSERQAYQLFSSYGWQKLFENANYNRVKHIARNRLKPEGIIVDL